MSPAQEQRHKDSLHSALSLANAASGDEMCYGRAGGLRNRSRTPQSWIAVLIVGELHGFGLVNKFKSFESESVHQKTVGMRYVL